jgi:glycosyltransferase involved in cell wall biosynthesis
MASRIVMVGDSLDAPGGISSVLKTYRDAGAFSAWNVVFISNYEGPGLFRQLLVMLRAMASYFFSLSIFSVSLVHIHSASRGSFWRAAIFATVARLFGRPYLIHLHSGEFLVFFDGCGSRGKRIIRTTLARAAGVVCVSSGWAKSFEGIVPSAVMHVLPNPVVVLPSFPDRHAVTGQDLLFLGRLNEKKGVMDLLAAFPNVLDIFPFARLVIAGDGDLEQMREAARRLGIESSVVFPGWIVGETKDRYLKGATVVVLPSHFEAFGVSVLEGMAYGKPVVATTVGGIPEIVSDGVHGYLVPPRAPSALADALIQLLSKPELASEMGASAYAHVKQNYSVPRVMGMLGDIYEKSRRD